MKLVTDYKNYASVVHRTPVLQPILSRSSWVPLREGCVKINTDTAILGNEEVGLGVVIRDSSGKVLVMAVRRYQARWKALLAEAMAVRFGMQVARRHGFVAAVELKGDAYNLSKAIVSKCMGRSPLDLVVEDIWLIGDTLIDFSISHVKQGGNTVAHLIARLCPSNGVEQFFVDDFPQGALALADLDVG